MPNTYEINKSNWTGETATLTVEDDGAFSIYDYKFRLVFSEDPSNSGASKYDLTIAKVVSIDGTWAHPLFTGTKMVCDKEWMFVSSGVVREDPNPYIAAAQVLFNII